MPVGMLVQNGVGVMGDIGDVVETITDILDHFGDRVGASVTEIVQIIKGIKGTITIIRVGAEAFTNPPVDGLHLTPEDAAELQRVIDEYIASGSSWNRWRTVVMFSPRMGVDP